jgi:hypothetical protein
MKKIVHIRQDEPGFYIRDGIKMAGRAGFEISKDCPQHIADIIGAAYSKGYIIPVANVLESEFVWEELMS